MRIQWERLYFYSVIRNLDRQYSMINVVTSVYMVYIVALVVFEGLPKNTAS